MNVCLVWSVIFLVITSFWFDSTVAAPSCGNYAACRGDTISGYYLYCHGELSCANTRLSDGTTRSCQGAYSCIDSIWSNSSSFLSSSALSLYNLTVYNSGVTMSGGLYGYYSGYNSTFYCYNHSSCSVGCAGNACVNLKLICDDTSTCQTSGTQIYNPSIDNAPEYYRGLPMIDAITESSIASDAYNGGTLCDGTILSCDGTTLSIDQSYYNIYCGGSSSCYKSSFSIASDVENSGIYCSAPHSCRDGSLIKNNNNNNNNNNITLFCGSPNSCRNSTIVGFNRVYGMANTALRDSIIISNGNSDTMNVYFGSYYAGGDAKIYCNYTDTCNIYCDAYLSCYTATAYCYGTCNVYCNTAYNGYCLTVNDYTNRPSNAPSMFVTDTVTTSAAPTVRTTISPIETTSNSVVTTDETGSTMTSTANDNVGDNGTNDNNNDNNNNNNESDLNAEIETSNWVLRTETWNIGGYACLTFSLAAPIIISILAHCYHKQEKYKFIDKPNYFALFACFWNFGDFYSDLIFAFVLITSENSLWYYSICFLLIPHFLSNFISLYNIKKWQTYNIYISKYIYRYDWLIISVSVLGGFYASIELARSKLFYLQCCSMQLTNEDYLKLQRFRFFNTVLFENVPQLFVQVLYTYNTNSMDIFVLSAMLFSLLSVLISISQHITQRKKYAYDTAAQVRLHYRVKKLFKMTIKCDKLLSHHRYCHEILTESLCSALGIDNTGNIEIFYVINIRNGIVAYMQVSNLHIEIDGINHLNNESEFEPGSMGAVKSTLFEKLTQLSDNVTQSKQIMNDGKENTILKEEITERLGLIFDDAGTADTTSTTGANKKDGNKIQMKISIVEDTKGLSADSDAVDIKLKHKKSMSHIIGNENKENILDRIGSVSNLGSEILSPDISPAVSPAVSPAISPSISPRASSNNIAIEQMNKGNDFAQMQQMQQMQYLQQQMQQFQFQQMQQMQQMQKMYGQPQMPIQIAIPSQNMGQNVNYGQGYGQQQGAQFAD